MDWRILHAEADGTAVRSLLDRRALSSDSRDDLRLAVGRIIDKVRAEGDAALLELTKAYDDVALSRSDLRLTPAEIHAGAEAVPEELRRAIGHAAENIRSFHLRQKREDIEVTRWDGSVLSLLFQAMGRVGVYIPGGIGGSTPLISTVLMCVIPAQVAGVPSVAVCSPPRPDGSLAPGLLAALELLGVDEVYRIGGAQAVAAMAYGTETIRGVDKIVGPGNSFVTEAKRQVFGQVGLDMLAGPSEVAIIADDTADPALIAADLLAQAEHDAEAGAFLFTPSRRLAEATAEQIRKQLPDLARSGIAEASLAKRGGAVVVRDLDAALALAEELAPEHLEIVTADPLALAQRVRNAGAVFVGGNAPEALGDYVAGTNHVLPTNGTARFASCLGVDDFLRRVSVLRHTAEGIRIDAPHGVVLAKAEGLTAHARSLQLRLDAEIGERG